MLAQAHQQRLAREARDLTRASRRGGRGQTVDDPSPQAAPGCASLPDRGMRMTRFMPLR
jgi:hypothetical protein